jgi:hypothetical protein
MQSPRQRKSHTSKHRVEVHVPRVAAYGSSPRAPRRAAAAADPSRIQMRREEARSGARGGSERGGAGAAATASRARADGVVAGPGLHEAQNKEGAVRIERTHGRQGRQETGSEGRTHPLDTHHRRAVELLCRHAAAEL